ncbi:MAG: amino acid ABC transporter substrate-binding protein [Pseudomonadota bacterium]
MQMTVRPILAAALCLGLSSPLPAAAGEVLDRIIERGTIKVGLRTDTPPFAFIEDGEPRGFTAELCGMMAGAVLLTSDLEALDAEVSKVTAENRFEKLTNGEIDVLCGATTVTLSRRETMSFTLPIFSTGVGAMLSADAPALMKEVLIDGGPASRSANAIREVLKDQRLGVRAGTTAEDWMKAEIIPNVEGVTMVAVDDHEEGIGGVGDGTLDVYFADKAILTGILQSAPDGERFLVSRATYTFEPYALAIPRGDEDLRLVLDRALSHLYRTGAIFKIYERHFGKPRAAELIFYGANALPE